MTGRTYDFIVQVANTSGFAKTNNFFGVSSNTEGLIVDVDSISGNIKVKTSNFLHKFSNGESVISTFVETSTANVEAQPFVPSAYQSQSVIATSTIDNIFLSPYIAEKNAFEQQPLVRLYTLYYPGEWYPTNLAGNPSLEGQGHSWPFNFPFRFAEIRGDLISDIQYRAIHDELEYVPFPINSDGISIDSSGKINDISLTVSNFDNLISTLVEDPFLVGNNTSNSVAAIVNGELVSNIDPRTVPGNSLYDQDVVDVRGGINVAFDYTSTNDVDGIWQQGKIDTRDLLGAAVEIKSTFANFLDVWPEYSTISGLFGNAVQVISTLPYRVGDEIKGNTSANVYTITKIQGINNLIVEPDDIFLNVGIGDKLFIINPEADPESFVLDVFKINGLESLNDQIGVFNLVSWLQFFKLVVPRRKYMKDTCPWVYKGEECQYPDSGTGPIPGDNLKTANGFFDIRNETVIDISQDVCAKNRVACTNRNNDIHYGGFIGTGIAAPR